MSPWKMRQANTSSCFQCFDANIKKKREKVRTSCSSRIFFADLDRSGIVSWRGCHKIRPLKIFKNFGAEGSRNASLMCTKHHHVPISSEFICSLMKDVAVTPSFQWKLHVIVCHTAVPNKRQGTSWKKSCQECSVLTKEVIPIVFSIFG